MFLVFSCCHSDLSVTHIMKRHVLGYGNADFGIVSLHVCWNRVVLICTFKVYFIVFFDTSGSSSRDSLKLCSKNSLTLRYSGLMTSVFACSHFFLQQTR